MKPLPELRRRYVWVDGPCRRVRGRELEACRLARADYALIGPGDLREPGELPGRCARYRRLRVRSSTSPIRGSRTEKVALETKMPNTNFVQEDAQRRARRERLRYEAGTRCEPASIAAAW